MKEEVRTGMLNQEVSNPDRTMLAKGKFPKGTKVQGAVGKYLMQGDWNTGFVLVVLGEKGVAVPVWDGCIDWDSPKVLREGVITKQLKGWDFWEGCLIPIGSKVVVRDDFPPNTVTPQWCKNFPLSECPLLEYDPESDDVTWDDATTEGA